MGLWQTQTLSHRILCFYFLSRNLTSYFFFFLAVECCVFHAIMLENTLNESVRNVIDSASERISFILFTVLCCRNVFFTDFRCPSDYCLAEAKDTHIPTTQHESEMSHTRYTANVFCFPYNWPIYIYSFARIRFSSALFEKLEFNIITNVVCVCVSSHGEEWTLNILSNKLLAGVQI